MKPFDHDLFTSPHHQEFSAANDTVDVELYGDASAFRMKMAELEASNHRLRGENLALRNRIHGLKSRRSIERVLIVGGTAAIWVTFVISIASKIMACS